MHLRTILLLLKEQQIESSKTHLQKGFPLNDGPFVKQLDVALQSFNVERQSYFGGAFIGNHVHKSLQVLKYAHV